MAVRVTVTAFDAELADVSTFSQPNELMLVGAKLHLRLSIDDDARRRSVVCQTEDELNGEELEALRALLARVQARIQGAYQQVIDGAATPGPAPPARTE